MNTRLHSKWQKYTFSLIFILLSIPSLSLALVPSSPRSQLATAIFKSTLEMEMKNKGLQYGSPLYIRIYKESKEFEIWVKKGSQFEYFKTYKIFTYGPGTLGPKLKVLDGQAPEGFYS